MRSIVLTAVSTFGAILLSGCSGFHSTPPAPADLVLAGIHGNIHGGQQPVAGALVQIYQAGTGIAGYGAGATGLIASGGVTTDANGNFNITGKYICTAGSQVYILATGGNPGAGTNSALALITGLGLCDNVTANTFVQVNEVTTVATVWALSPFMTGTVIGAPATNAAGLASAFADIPTLVNTTSGYAPGPALPATATAPVSEIYAIANSLAACVNSTGTGGGGTCDQLFANTTVAAVKPTNTVAAAVNIARNPGVNVSAILALGAATPPYPTNFTTANDLTLAVTYKGSGISAPTAAALDANGNVWIANSGTNSVTELSHTGAPLSGTAGYSTGAASLPSAIAIDASGNAWVADAGTASLTRLTASGTASTYTGGGLATPSSLAFDGLGNVWVANSGNASVSEFSASGTAISPAGSGYPTGTNLPVGIAINPH